MKKTFFSHLLVISLLLSLCIPAMAAEYDLLLGDVDSDTALTAGDARLVLRASVGLEAIDKEKKIIADVDADENITSGDARLILRASVGLENIDKFYHIHTLQDFSVIGSCTESTIIAQKCGSCGITIVTDVIEATGHDWGEYDRIGNLHYRECKVCSTMESGECVLVESVIPATCTQDGKIVKACICGWGTEEIIPGGHSYGNWSKKSDGSFTSTCATCKQTQTATKSTLLAWYNSNVNKLKAETNDDATVTILRSTKTKIAAENFSASFLLVESLLEEALNTSTLTYGAPSKNRQITNNILPAIAKDYVSDLTMNDVKSFDISLGQTVNLLSDLPQTFDVTSTVNGTEKTTTYDISDYKNTNLTNAVKVTVKINDETATRTGNDGTKNIYSFTSGGKAFTPTEENPFIMQRFYGMAMLEKLCDEFPKHSDSDGTEMYIDCKNATSAAEAVWYFDSETLEPIACVYTINLNMIQNVDLTTSLISGSLDLNSDIAYTYYYLFDKYYPVTTG